MRFNAGWYLIYTKPRHEKKVSAQLFESDINNFLPTKKVLRSWHDRKKYVEEPLFPSYVFIYLNELQYFYKGLDIDGALCYVRAGKEIARVSQAVIDNIKLVSSEVKDYEVSATPFTRGRQLVISKGPLTGLSCEVIQYNNKKKLLVRVDLLQRHLLVTVSDHDVMAV